MRILCESHGASPGVHVCSHISGDVLASRPLRHFHTYFLGAEGFPGSPLYDVPYFCDECVEANALPAAGALIAEETWELEYGHLCHTFRPACYPCFKQYAQQEIPHSFCKTHSSSDIVRVCSHIAEDVQASRSIRHFKTYFVSMKLESSPQTQWFVIPHFCDECAEIYNLPEAGALLPAEAWEYKDRHQWNTRVICEACFKLYSGQEIPPVPSVV